MIPVNIDAETLSNPYVIVPVAHPPIASQAVPSWRCGFHRSVERERYLQKSGQRVSWKQLLRRPGKDDHTAAWLHHSCKLSSFICGRGSPGAYPTQFALHTQSKVLSSKGMLLTSAS